MDLTEVDESMINAPRGPVPEGEVDVHKPFTTSERFEQLKEIDNDIISLLEHTARAVQALNKPPVENASAPNDTNEGQPEPAPFDSQAQLMTFKSAMYDFVATLDFVDKRMKRQILGLEEAGILTLKSSSTGTIAGERPKPSLRPDGEGKIGGLDVGRLNAGGPTVERAMEKELWAKAREHLASVVEKRTASSNATAP